MNRKPGKRPEIPAPRPLARTRRESPIPTGAPTSTGEFAPYQDARLVNQGGMGAIYRAHDPGTNRHVAIKLLLPGGSQRELYRFFAEGQVTAQLEHPNIVPVHEVGMTEDGRLFLVMKFVEGRSLAEALKEDRPGPELLPGLLDLFCKVCDAVSFAHSRGVIHRDLKPQNIMIGKFGEVLVMDWGIARRVGRAAEGFDPVRVTGLALEEAEPATNPSLTQEGTVIGTLIYMPPEQAAGDIGQIDERSDVYSLGAILYQILTLRPPFSGKESEIAEALLSGNVVAPSLRVAGRAIPRELDHVVLRAMAFRPQDRYDSVLALETDVQAFRAGRILAGVRYRLWQRAAKWATRHRAWVIPAVIFLLLAAAFALHALTRPGSLEIAAAPAGARVEIVEEDVSFESDGSTHRVEVRPGRHRVRATLADHVAVEVECFVERNETREIPIELAHETGLVSVATEPGEAVVLMDGVSHGTPLVSREVLTGTKSVVVEKLGHYRERIEFEVKAGREVELDLGLVPAIAWSRPLPDSAEVRITGDVDGDRTPDVTYVHYGRVSSLLSGATGVPLREAREIRIVPETRGEWLDVDRDGFLEWLTCLVEEEDPAGFSLAAISTSTGKPFWKTPPLPVALQRAWGCGDKDRPFWWGAPDLDGDGVSDAILCLAEPEPALAAFSTRDGRPLWKRQLEEPGWSAKSDWKEGGRTGIVIERASRLRYIDGATGETVREEPAPPPERPARPAASKPDWLASLPAALSAGPLKADVDDDGVAELGVATAAGDFRVLAADGEELFGTRVAHPIDAILPLHADGDGLLDFLLVGRRALSVVRGRRLHWIREMASEARVAPAFADVDGDGGADLLLPFATRGEGEAIVALAGRTGKTLWANRFNNNSIRPLLLADIVGGPEREVVAWTTSKALRALEVSSGRTLADVGVPANGYAEPAAGDLDGDGRDDLVALGWWDDGASAAIAGGSLERLWEARMGAQVYAGATIADIDGDRKGEVFVATTGGRVLSLDGRTGRVRWEAANPGMNRARIAIGRRKAGGSFVAAVNRGAYLDRDSKIHGELALHDAATGELLFSFDEGGGSNATPLFVDADGDGEFEVLAGARARIVLVELDGGIRWRLPTTGAPFDASPVAVDLDADGTLEALAADMAGVLRVIDLASGRVEWQWSTPGASAIEADPVVADVDGDGDLDIVVASHDGRIHCLEGSGLAHGPRRP